ncbi:MAG: helix-turn-helix transcriptional regulator [Lachnospiraceae bacterium]|nr:helix-turn-helix transcriptional regulator [Lachnospiraceae bacterium]
MLGSLLKDLRITQHISRQTLIDGGLCSLDMLKKYENGQKQPEKLLGDALWQRLGKSMEKFDIFLEQDEYELACTRAHIQMRIRQGQLAKAEEILCVYENMEGTDRPLHRQFICLQRAELYRRMERPYMEQMGIIQEGLKWTVSNALLPGILETHRFDMLELLLLERYVFLLEQKSPEEAVQWYNKLVRYLTGENGIDYDYADQYRLLPPILYRQAVRAAAAGFYQMALEKLQEGSRMLSECQAFLPLFIKMEELKLEILSKTGKEIPTGEAGCLCLLKEIMEKSNPAWKQNIYSDYPERSIHCVNTTLRERRLAYGKTIKDMAGELDLRTLKAVESGKRMPQAATKNRLFQELGLPTQKYCSGLVTRRYSDFRDRAKMIKYNYEGKHEDAERIYKKLVSGLNREEIINEQFINYWDIRLRYSGHKLTRKEYQRELWELLKKTLPKCEEISMDCVLAEYEREIVKNLAWEVDTEATVNIEKILYTQYKKFCNDDDLIYFFPEYYTTLARCVGQIIRLRHDDSQSQNILTDTLRQFYFLQDDFRLGSFFLQHFFLEESIRKAQGIFPAQDDDKYFQDVRYAYAINKLYMRDSVCVNYIEEYLDKHYGKKDGILKGLL